MGREAFVKHLRLLALVCLCLLSACSKRAIKDLPPQSWQGFEVQVLSVEAKGSPYTKKSENLTCSAKEGSEVMVAEISFKPQSQTGPVSAPLLRLVLEDAEGKKYESFGMPSIGPDSMIKNKAWEFCFEVPKGAELKTLRVADLSFDLR